MKLESAVVALSLLLGASLVAGSILFIERYQISAIGYGFAGDGEHGSDNQDEKVFRLDRWTGDIEYCSIGGGDPKGFAENTAKTGHATFTCAYPTDAATARVAAPPPQE